MNKVRIILRNLPALVVGGLSVGLLLLVARHPSRGNFPFLKETTALADQMNTSMKTVPVLHPSQTREILDYIDSLGSRPAEGFFSLVSSTKQDLVLTYRYPLDRWLKGWRVNNRNPGEEVVWLTPPRKTGEKTTYVFSGALGGGEGKADFRLSGRTILTINTGGETHRTTWEEGGYSLRFFPLRRINPQILCESGIFCLTVPAGKSNPESGLEVAVRSVGAEGRYSNWSYFTLYDYTDTRDLLDNPLYKIIDEDIDVRNL